MSKPRFLSAALCGLILALCLPLFSSCRSQPPALEEVYDRLVELVDGAVDVNVILFGAGLPVYPRGSDEDALIHRYYGVPDNGTEYVSEYARYTSIEEMEAAIRAVYGKSYADSLVDTLFTGYSIGYGESSILSARYTSDGRRMYQSTHYEPLVSGVRIFDFSTMQILPASTATYLKVSIKSRADREGSEWKTTDLSFVYENGNWYLDGPCC